jgi:hypothetical protein
MPEAYQGLLYEIVRRQKFTKSIKVLIDKLSASLTKIREDEINKRRM